MAYWAEIRNNYFDNTIAPNEGDLLASIAIDAWHEMDDAEEGKIIAQVLLSKHGDVLVDYHDNVARIDEMAQAAIKDAIVRLKDYYIEISLPAKDDSSEFNKLLVFDEELCVQDENHVCIDGYLWATDGLVARLKGIVSSELSEVELSDMENINFYSVYNLSDGTMELYATFWYETEDGMHAKHCQQQMPLTDNETKVLISAMDEYCSGSYGMNLLNFLNKARAQENLPELPDPKAPFSIKVSLDAQIASASQRQTAHDPQSERPEPALGR